jgi:hypothetical protein
MPPHGLVFYCTGKSRQNRTASSVPIKISFIFFTDSRNKKAKAAGSSFDILGDEAHAAGKEPAMALNPIKKSYFPKPPKQKYSLEGHTGPAVMAPSEAPPSYIIPRILLVLFAIGLIGYTLTHSGVRIDIEVDLSNWKGGTASGPNVKDAKDAQMNVLANAVMHELSRQGIYPETVDVNQSTISITAPKAPTTGSRLTDMVDNMLDCHVGAFEWQGTSVDTAMLQNISSCETLFDTCGASVNARGQTQLDVTLTPEGRAHFADFEHTMVFVKAADPLAMIYDYQIENNGHLTLKSSHPTPTLQQLELSQICDAVKNRNRLAGVAFTGITTHRIAFGVPTL